MITMWPQTVLVHTANVAGRGKKRDKREIRPKRFGYIKAHGPFVHSAYSKEEKRKRRGLLEEE